MMKLVITTAMWAFFYGCIALVVGFTIRKGWDAGGHKLLTSSRFSRFKRKEVKDNGGKQREPATAGADGF